MTTDNKQYFGFADPTSWASQFNELRFTIQQQMLKLNTSMPVQVVSVKTTGLAPVGFVGIRILVDQVTGDGMTFPHAEIPNVPYFRLQGGRNAVIIDPEVGDIGMASFCSRDISAVKNVRQAAPPGSARSYDFSDCAYFGGILNGTPTQYIHFTNSGIVVYSPTQVKVEAPSVLVESQTTTVNSPTVNVNATQVNVNSSQVSVDATQVSVNASQVDVVSGTTTIDSGQIDLTAASINASGVGGVLQSMINGLFVQKFNEHVHAGPDLPPTVLVGSEVLSNNFKAS